MNAPALRLDWHATLRDDAVTVAVAVDSDMRPALAGALAWRRSWLQGVAAQDVAVALSEELAALGMPLSVPVLSEAPAHWALLERATLRWRASRMGMGARQRWHDIVIERVGGAAYRMELGERYAMAALDGVERAAFTLLRDARRIGWEPTDALRARVAEIRGAVETAIQR